MWECIGERAEHLLRWAQGERAPPVKFDLFLTNKCNLRCQFCHYPRLPAFRYENELSHEEILSLVEQAGEMGAKVFGILGGEPFLRKKTCLEAMELAKRHGMAGSLVTNGSLLIRNDLRRIIDLKWDLLRFSIDAPDAVLHDELRGVKGSFGRAVNALRQLQRLKKEQNLHHPTVEINMVLTRTNAHVLPGMVRLCSEHGVEGIYVLPVIEFGKDISHLKLIEADAQGVLAHMEEAEELSMGLGVRSNLASIKQDALFTKSNAVDTVLLDSSGEEQHIPCFMPWYAMSIDAQGWLTPCGQIETETQANVRDYPSLREAWASSYFTALRDEMAKKRLPKGCERCCMPMMDENVLLRKALNQGGEDA